MVDLVSLRQALQVMTRWRGLHGSFRAEAELQVRGLGSQNVLYASRVRTVGATLGPHPSLAADVDPELYVERFDLEFALLPLSSFQLNQQTNNSNPTITISWHPLTPFLVAH